MAERPLFSLFSKYLQFGIIFIVLFVEMMAVSELPSSATSISYLRLANKEHCFCKSFTNSTQMQLYVGIRMLRAVSEVMPCIL